mmetsp:Transcript_4077/g.12274  ORF Transcript_4077/g.12274 Transcript_4077/m.12274 type:complete len:234 (+) Transcript_4077:1148-1849(+)
MISASLLLLEQGTIRSSSPWIITTFTPRRLRLAIPSTRPRVPPPKIWATTNLIIPTSHRFTIFALRYPSTVSSLTLVLSENAAPRPLCQKALDLTRALSKTNRKGRITAYTILLAMAPLALVTGHPGPLSPEPVTARMAGATSTRALVCSALCSAACAAEMQPMECPIRMSPPLSLRSSVTRSTRSKLTSAFLSSVKSRISLGLEVKPNPGVSWQTTRQSSSSLSLPWMPSQL